MSRKAKAAFFFVAVLVMACFAVGSVMMAEQKPGLASLLFIVAVVGAAFGFVSKRKVMKR